MSYYGMMDGFHGDENECHGQCGLCIDCEQRYDQFCDESYDQWREDELA